MQRGISRIGMALAFLVCVVAGFGCSGSGHSTTSQTVAVSITNKTTSVPASGSVTFNASVTNDSADQGVTWTIAPATGAGTISANSTTSVTYTAPATPPTTNSVTITATSVADSTKSDSVTFSIAAKTPPAISVSITNKISTINAGATAVTLNATVTNDSANAGVSWTLTVSGAKCSPACGNLSTPTTTSVVFTPPATLPAAPNNAPVITATSVTDTTKSDTDAITIQAAVQASIEVSITNKFSTIAAGSADKTVNVTVTNDPKNDGVNWTLTAGGTACSPACGMLKTPDQFSVIYSPPTTPGAAPNNTPTITATSATDSTKSDNFSFTVSPAAASLGNLNGHYAALLQGADGKLNPRAMVMSFTADGAGRITQASVDLNDDFQVSSAQGPVTGTYTVDTSFENSIRGQINIPSFTFPSYPGSPTSPALQFVFVLAADGKSGNIEERDAGLSVTSGKFYLQNSSDFGLGDLAGGYAFGFSTPFNQNVASNSNWQAMVGRFFVNFQNGEFLNATVDSSVAQSGQALSNAELDGYLGQVDSTGRLTMNFVPNFGTPMEFVGYVVDNTKIVFVEFDPSSSGATTIFGGLATLQKSTLSKSSLNGASVFWANGEQYISDMGSSAAVGRMVFTNSTSANIEYDRSYNATGHPANNTGSALQVTLDTNSGRATVTFPNGASNLLFDSAVLYLTDTNTGYLLDTTTSTKAEALFGTLVPQSTGPFDATYLSGNVRAMRGGYESREATQFFGGFIFSGSSGAYDTFDYYQDNSGNVKIGSDTGDATNVLGSIDATTGRGTGKFDPSGNQCSGDSVCSTAFYLIGKNQAVMVNQPAAAPSTQEDSSVTFIDPQ